MKYNNTVKYVLFNPVHAHEETQSFTNTSQHNATPPQTTARRQRWIDTSLTQSDDKQKEGFTAVVKVVAEACSYCVYRWSEGAEALFPSWHYYVTGTSTR